MTRILLLTLLTILHPTTARRGALIRDGMSSKAAYDNPLLGQAGDITIDPDVVAITSRCANWCFDPVCLDRAEIKAEERSICKEVLKKDVLRKPLHVTFRSKTLAGGKRPNWMRATAILGNPKLKSAIPLRAVWTCSNPDADASMSYEETSQAGRTIKKEIGKNVLRDSYEDCLKRLYGKYVELEVLLPKSQRSGPPPSLVYRVPIHAGSVNRLGMVSKSRATVTLYPKGRTLAAADAGGPKAASVPRDWAVPVGLVNVHLPLGPGLVDPSWVRGKKLFWRGRSVGLI
ncbi:hypothetical protein ACHAW6_005978 [Cyclotella cf. meneghiniana]